MKEKDNIIYHKTKLLLGIYRKVIWRMEDALYEADAFRYEFGSERISDLVDFLSIEIDDYISVEDKKRLEERLMNITETKRIIEIIDKAMIKLKTHPENGEMYFYIINDSYISSEKKTDYEIQIKNNLSQSTYYRQKKKAIELMGIILWGYILPSLRELWDPEAKYNLASEDENPYNI